MKIKLNDVELRALKNLLEDASMTDEHETPHYLTGKKTFWGQLTIDSPEHKEALKNIKEKLK